MSSDYLYELAPATWNVIRDTRSGTVVFGMPAGPVTCAGPPQKIAHLAAEHWRREGEVTEVRSGTREAVVADRRNRTTSMPPCDGSTSTR